MTAPPGNHYDGNGLWLHVTPAGSKSWVWRFSWRGRRPELGLGSLRDVSLSQAREKALEARRLLLSGINPIEAKRAATTERAGKRTFGEIADALLETKAAEWRNPKHREQWRVSLVNGAAQLRARFVDEIDTEAILAVLKPIWTEKAESAMRLRARIEAVLDAAAAKGHRVGDNPARWRGHLQHLLPKRGKLDRGHHAALPYAEVPAFMARLREIDTVSARALEFAILTAGRSGEVYGATWSEIDLEAKV